MPQMRRREKAQENCRKEFVVSFSFLLFPTWPLRVRCPSDPPNKRRAPEALVWGHQGAAASTERPRRKA
eukprot:358285-Alexandrium_andersonii.AAC.1